MRQNRRPGERLFVDCAGMTMIHRYPRLQINMAEQPVATLVPTPHHRPPQPFDARPENHEIQTHASGFFSNLLARGTAVHRVHGGVGAALRRGDAEPEDRRLVLLACALLRGHRKRRRRNRTMKANWGPRATRGSVLAPLRGGGTTGPAVPQHAARAMLRLVRAHASRAHHAPPPCPKAFGGGTDDGAIAEGEPPTPA